MPVELRKRKAPPPPPEPPAKKQTKPKAGKSAPASDPPATENVTKAAAKAAEAVKQTVAQAAETASDAASAVATAATTTATNGGDDDKSAKKIPEVGDVISLEGFGGEVETNDGDKVTLKGLVDESKAGVVLVVYPRANTGGCKKQVCFFRDSYEPFQGAGLSVYGLSTDSPKSNTTFKVKEKLQYPLLCDPSGTLLGAIGLKKASSKSATRGVFVVDKNGKVLASGPGSPEGTLNTVKDVVKELGASNEEVEEKKEEPTEEEAKAE
ncbi:peroxiredoxin Q/BCP, partial [Podospora australis]